MIPGIVAGGANGSGGGGGGGIVFLSQNYQNFISNSTSHLVDMPATVNAGDLVCVAVGCAVGPTTMTTPPGWTLVATDYEASSSAIRAGIYIKICSGSEGGTQVDFQTSVPTTVSAAVMRLSGASSDVEATAPTTINNSSNYACPTLSPTWGSEDTLWRSLHFGNYLRTVTQHPLPDNQVAYPVNNFVSIYSSTEIENTASKTPANMILSAGQYGMVYTLAFRPN